MSLPISLSVDRIIIDSAHRTHTNFFFYLRATVPTVFFSRTYPFIALKGMNIYVRRSNFSELGDLLRNK